VPTLNLDEQEKLGTYKEDGLGHEWHVAGFLPFLKIILFVGHPKSESQHLLA
jgi:hypothetical protein